MEVNIKRNKGYGLLYICRLVNCCSLIDIGSSKNGYCPTIYYYVIEFSFQNDPKKVFYEQ